MGKTISYTRSSIQPEILWQEAPEIFVVDIPPSDPDLVALIAKGLLDIPASPPPIAARVSARMASSYNPLRSKLIEVIVAAKKLSLTTTRIWFHGAFYLPDHDRVAVLIALHPPPEIPSPWIATSARDKARELFAAHEIRVKEWEHQREKTKQEDEQYILGEAEGRREVLRKVFIYEKALWSEPPPAVRVDEIVPLLHSGLLAGMQRKRDATRQNAVIELLGSSVLEAPRDGEHLALLCRGLETRHSALVTWTPRGPLPPYPEIRRSVEIGLPRALSRPRRGDVSPPLIDSGNTLAPVRVETINLPSELPFSEYNDLNLPFNNLKERAGNARTAIRQGGIEALGWYQPFHVWNGETWGIYLDGEKIDDFACALYEDLSTQRQHTHQLAMLLAWQLVYQHELFHARVEACLSWLELTNLSPRHQRYKKGVCQATRGTDDCLEEALANWFSAKRIREDFQGFSNERCMEVIERVVAANLDMSPPGYRVWRKGEKATTWRDIANEIVSGKQTSEIRSKLPLESLLKDPLPFDFQPCDIPMRVVGSSVVIDALLSSPKTFSTPSRREIESALRHFGYTPEKGRGKGSHQLWVGPDQRGFPIPGRDPLSQGVFKSFLHHFNIDKSTYVEKVRPCL